MGKRFDKVKGQCPQGCGETLFVGQGGHITCSWHQCPNPSSVGQLLDDRQTSTHVVHYDTEGRFSIQHPLSERLTLGIELTLCPLHRFLTNREPLGAGRYEAVEDETPKWRLAPV